MKPVDVAKGKEGRLLERLHSCVDHADREMAKQLLQSLLRVESSARVTYAHWRCLSLDEDLAPAEAVAREGALSYPDDPALHHALGWTLAQGDHLEDAITALERACELDPSRADSWYDLGITHESLGNSGSMRRAFARVYALDTAEPRPPNLFATEEILSWADRAVRMLPAKVREAVKVLPIFVQDYPDDWILEEPPWDPRLLGLFDGPTFALWESIDTPQSTPHVYLFQRNLERLCPDPRLMAEQVRVTVHHEVGHFLGLDEVELIDRGLG